MVSLATDALGFRWGACFEGEELGDFWEEGDARSIHIKEAQALLVSLQSLGEKLRDHRVDAWVNNQAVVHSWN